MHNERLVFLDTETGGLRRDDRAWEVALLIEQDGKPDEQHVIHISDFAPAQADPAALNLSGFYDRHPLWADDPDLCQLGVTGPDPDLPVDHRVIPEAFMVRHVERLTRRSVVLGCNPGFDTFRILESAFYRHGCAPTWHYRPVCATTYAAAYVDAQRARSGAEPLPLPWNNETVGQHLDISRDQFGPIHSGLGDAHYARALLRASRGVWEWNTTP